MSNKNTMFANNKYQLIPIALIFMVFSLSSCVTSHLDEGYIPEQGYGVIYGRFFKEVLGLFGDDPEMVMFIENVNNGEQIPIQFEDSYNEGAFAIKIGNGNYKLCKFVFYETSMFSADPYNPGYKAEIKESPTFEVSAKHAYYLQDWYTYVDEKTTDMIGSSERFFKWVWPSSKDKFELTTKELI